MDYHQKLVDQALLTMDIPGPVLTSRWSVSLAPPTPACGLQSCRGRGVGEGCRGVWAAQGWRQASLRLPFILRELLLRLAFQSPGLGLSELEILYLWVSGLWKETSWSMCAGGRVTVE